MPNLLTKYSLKAPMYDKGELVGIALRSRKNCNPNFISPGNNVSLEQSIEVIKHCIKGYRIPESTRQAHLLVNKIRIENGENLNQQGVLF